ncbi:hypothetical protein [Massilia sp. MS-15]|uniref:hypothetical protein n=1 Tax=Massilia sp. MS-15 TaxID=2878200 RepID=UPI001CD708AA|nr:hypothetical protein [Massilia sp. MS-15]MCA1246508.1 hypothetical protein [Massilia sp. MS-15]
MSEPFPDLSSRTTAVSDTRRLVSLLAGSTLLAAGSLVQAAPGPAKSALPAVADFQKLSGSRAARCSVALEPALRSLGTPALRQCAWSGRVEMLYWQDIADIPHSCLPTAAIAWHRLGAGAHAVLRPWSGSWSGQSLQLQYNGVEHAGMVWRQPDGGWSAVLWRWRPSERLATRNWQRGHWKDVAAAVRAVDAANPAPPRTPLMMAWLDATNGKPRAIDGDAWRWVSADACLSLQTASLGQAQLHLPHSRDDARLEQRSAMQVQLARRFPQAQWLRPFTLVEPAISGDRTGAKFLAVWQEGAAVRGQLWIPLRDQGGIVRARISSALPAAGGTRAAESGKARAALIERELGALAHAWEARHE